MRNPKLILAKIGILFLIIFLLVSCENKPSKKILPGSIGRFNELVVVINEKDWEGKIGLALREVIESEVVGLPQPEPQFSVTQIAPRGFDGFLKHNRNILRIKQGEKAAMNIAYDQDAKGQVIVELVGPTKDAIVNFIKQNENKLIQVFKQHDLQLVRKRLSKKPHDFQKTNFYKNHQINLNVPKEYLTVKNEDDFIWYRRRIEHAGYQVNGSLNIIAYALPVDYTLVQLQDSIINIRNAVGKKNIPGETEGGYMMTEAAYEPHIFPAEINGRKALKVLGKWEIYNEFVAGPFVSYFVPDPDNDRLIVVEGIVYAPIIKKRDFIFEQDAILNSLKVQ